MTRLRWLSLPLLIPGCGGDQAPSPTQESPDSPTTTEETDTGPDTILTDTGSSTAPTTDPCPGLTALPADATIVGPTDAATLQSVLDAANPGDTIALEDGTYSLGGSSLVLSVEGTTLRSVHGDPSAVTLDANYSSQAILIVQASDVTIAGIGLHHAAMHAIRVLPESTDISNVQIHEILIVDAGSHFVTIEPDTTSTFFADDGVIACSQMELTSDGRAEVVGLCETGAVHAEHARGWVVRDNRIDGFWCEGDLSDPGIRFALGTRDTVIERNVLVDVAWGIVVGRGTDLLGRTYADAPCDGQTAQDYGCVVRNNFIWSADVELVDSLPGLDVGIGLESACDAQVLHNTVYSATEPYASIVFRHPLTSGVVVNNLANYTIRRELDATSEANSNIENAPDSTFMHAPSGDLHLSPAAEDAIDGGSTDYTTLVQDDIDGAPREDGAPDIGADER